MDRESWFIDFAQKNGRKRLYPYAIGIIKNIMSRNYHDAKERENDIRDVLEDLDGALHDESLPWDAEIKKPSVTAESERKLFHLIISRECRK